MLIHLVAAGALVMGLPSSGQIQQPSAGQTRGDAKASEAVNEQYRKLDVTAEQTLT